MKTDLNRQICFLLTIGEVKSAVSISGFENFLKTFGMFEFRFDEMIKQL